MHTFYIAMFVVWAFVAIISIIIELNTAQQIGFAASLGAIVAIITHAAVSDKIWPEFIAFGVTWIISWLVFYFIIMKTGGKIHDNDDGFFAFIGREEKAVSGNETGFGRLNIGDKSFRFISKNKIKKGDIVVIDSIKGTTMSVSKKNIKK